MQTSTKVIGAIDLAIETLFALSWTPFIGYAAWHRFPGSPYARAFLDDIKK